MSEDLNPFEYFVCGGFGGICTVITGHPLDTIKVLLQTTTTKPGEPPLYTGTWDCLKKTVQRSGPLGLYKGMAAPLTGVAPIFAISFFGFGVGKKIFRTDKEDHRMIRTFLAGAFSGIFTTSIMAPGERIKCLLQIQQAGGPKLYDGPVDCAKKLYKEGGIKNIYRGSVATLMRDVPASGLYFLTYQALTEALTPPGQKMSFAVTIFAGGMAGIANWLIGMPSDVIKSLLQTAPTGKYPNGLRDVIPEILQKNGIAGFYKGLTPVLLRAFPANAACFLGFEIAANVFRNFH